MAVNNGILLQSEAVPAMLTVQMVVHQRFPRGVQLS